MLDLDSFIKYAGALGLGTFIGSLISGWIQSGRDRKNWLRNNRRDEFRELITVLTKAISMVYLSHDTFASFHDPKVAGGDSHAIHLVAETLSSRIYIAKELANVRSEWTNTLQAYRSSSNANEFEVNVNHIVTEIVTLANKL